MITKTFGTDFTSYTGALTLNTSEVSENKVSGGIHKSGWTITGRVHEDWFVNEFEATHPQYGRVWGDFEDKVYADSEKGFEHFYKNHTPKAWIIGIYNSNR